MKFKALQARTLAKDIEREQTTASGIMLPGTAKEKPQTDEVVAVCAHEDTKASVERVVVVREYSGTEASSTGRSTESEH